MALRSKISFLIGITLSFVYYRYFFGSFNLGKWEYLICFLAFYLPTYVDGSEYHCKSRYWNGLARWSLWKLLFKYFPAKLVLDQPGSIDPKKQYIFASHPHGPMSVHHVMMITNAVGFHDISPGTNRRDLAASITFRIPIFRELLLWLGCVDASRATAVQVLKSGKSMVTLVGGMDEQLLARPGDNMVYVKDRMGFVKLALQYGTPIVPCYAFGENDLYRPSNFLFSFRKMLLKKFRMALPLCYGVTPLFPLLPLSRPLTLVVGAPIPVAQLNPNDDLEAFNQEATRLHQRYIEELKELFNKHKKVYAQPDAELEVR
eukprot:TRINITY_DN823_c0_g1_i4.p1 TRINITY_DN823_c0_g1~~TRINITY_DN823_c0_g1_i4.p1  ORF type:complete len:337 (-),score=96.58 TRINITY_DN823_c0_g1_i4:58-1008(-)